MWEGLCSSAESKMCGTKLCGFDCRWCDTAAGVSFKVGRGWRWHFHFRSCWWLVNCRNLQTTVFNPTSTQHLCCCREKMKGGSVVTVTSIKFQLFVLTQTSSFSGTYCWMHTWVWCIYYCSTFVVILTWIFVFHSLDYVIRSFLLQQSCFCRFLQHGDAGAWMFVFHYILGSYTCFMQS